MNEADGRPGRLKELAFWLALAFAAFALSFQFSGEIGTYQWGAASWPRAVILLMAIAALVHAFAPRPAPDDSGGAETARAPIAPSLGLFLIPLVYVWLLPRTGFYLTTPFFLIAYLLHVGERRWPAIALTVVIITALAYLVFAKLFYVALPVGHWPGFYEVNNWLLTAIR
jgi:hypothetical protein